VSMRWIKFKPKNKQHTPNLSCEIFPACPK
jgi:hypothetical protein